MKSLILILAVIALAQDCCMSAHGMLIPPFSFGEVYQGFSEKLKIPAEVNDLGKSCYESIFKTLQNPTFYPPKKTLEENIIWFSEQSYNGKMNFLTEVEKKVFAPLMPTCGRFIHAIKVHFAQEGLTKDGILFGYEAKQNFIKYHATIISQIIRANEKSLFEPKPLGEALAYALEVLSGKVVPKSPEFKDIKMVPVDSKEALTAQMVNTFRKEVGVNGEITVERALQFNQAFGKFLEKTFGLYLNFVYSRGTLRGKSPFAIIDTIGAILKFRKEVQDIESFFLENTQKVNPRSLVYSIVRDLDILEDEYKEFYVRMNHNQGVESGKILARMIKRLIEFRH